MRNRKSMDANPMNLVIGAAILIGVLLIIIFGVIPILTGKQVPFIKGQTESITQDCDSDGYTGIADACPCVSTIQTLDKGKVCPQPDAQATNSCPNLCKSFTVGTGGTSGGAGGGSTK
mgnify:CR=1 FL=1